MSRAEDLRARRAACEEFERPLVLVAGAGTGKTTALVARVVTWLVGPGLAAERQGGADDELAIARAVDGVLAITFTKAAAAEMDQRVRAALHDLEAGRSPRGVLLGGAERLPSGPEREIARRLRLALDRPIATTIHGFCQALLTEHPLEAGLPPGFEVDGEGELLPEIARAAVEADLAESFAAGRDRAWEELSQGGVGPDAVAEAVARLRGEGVRARDMERDPISDAALEALLARVAEALGALLGTGVAQLVNIAGAAAIQRVARTLVALDELLRARGRQPPAATITAARELGLGECVKKLREWTDGGWGQRAAGQLGAGIDEATRRAGLLRAPLRGLSQLDPAGLAARRSVLLRVLARAEREGDAQGVLSYGDLLVRAVELVRGRPEVARRLRARYRQVLVDEFQDTDDVQCGLIEALALSGDGPRPGLFLVGDPKQSIYGWRSADLAAYDAFVERIVRTGGRREALTQNFRSTRRVLDAVSQLVAPVLREERGVQPAFQALDPHEERPGPPVELWCTWETSADITARLGQTSSRRAAELEASALAHALLAERAAGTPWKSMAVLVRSRSGLESALEALREAAIPFQVEGDRSYYRRREVLDACALLAAVADPGDELALLAFLRSAACGLPDAALEPLWAALVPCAVALGRGDDEPQLARIRALAHATERRLSALPPPGGRSIPGFAHALVHALEALAALRRSLHAEPADVFLERVRALLLLEPAEIARHQGRYRGANLERFFRHVGEELDVAGDARGLLRTLRRALDQQREQKDARPQGQAEEAVRILTIHASKGLEFDAVFAIGLKRRSRRSGAQDDAYDRQTGEHRLLGQPTPMWWQVEERVARRESAEQVRLLYVAATRAKRRLVLCGTWREAFARHPVERCTSFADLLEHGAPAALEAELSTMVGVGRDESEVEGFSVRLLHAADAPRSHDAPGPDLGRLADEARRDADQLAPMRAEASQRSRKARVLAASARAHRPPGATPGSVAATVAPRDVGTLVHAALEQLPLAPAPDWEAAHAALEWHASAAGAKADVFLAARELLDSIARGPLAARFSAIAHGVVARELALSAPAQPHDPALDALHGAADLVYRDGEAWVVADYKSDAPVPGIASEAVAARHAPQLDAYAAALQEALGLARQPRREVWLLRAGEVVTLP